MKKTLLLAPLFGLLCGSLGAQNNYEDGTLFLNEGWFGHESGSLNYISPEGETAYRVFAAENPGLSLGATSCCAIVYGGKLFVSSKQAYGTGDNGSGGRFIVADARTLKQEASVAELPGGGDGRSLVGVAPGKVYIGTTAGIVAMTQDGTTWTGSVIDGTYDDTNYGQAGDMVKAGRYVFAVQENRGVLVIDPEKDVIVQTISEPDVQVLTQGFDGNVWVATSTMLFCLDSSTLATTDTRQMPANGGIPGSWGSWKPSILRGSTTENVIYWNGGGGSWTAGTDFYRYEVGSDMTSLQPFFTISGLAGATADNSQEIYGSVNYDGRTNRLVIPTTQSGWGANYMQNWIHFVDCTTGEIDHTVKLEEAYWFPETAVFPDKYAPEVSELDDVTLHEGDAATEIDLGTHLADHDNLAANISCTLADAGNAEIVDAELDGRSLKLTPKAQGETEITLSVESNGVVIAHKIGILVDNTEGIAGATTGKSVKTANGAIEFTGYAGRSFTLYAANGRKAADLRISADRQTINLNLPSGVYILRTSDGGESVTKKLLF